MKQFILISTTAGDCLLPVDRISFIRPITDDDKISASIPATFTWNGCTYEKLGPLYLRNNVPIDVSAYITAKEVSLLSTYADFHSVIKLTDDTIIRVRNSVGAIHLQIQNTK